MRLAYTENVRSRRSLVTFLAAVRVHHLHSLSHCLLMCCACTVYSRERGGGSFRVDVLVRDLSPASLSSHNRFTIVLFFHSTTGTVTDYRLFHIQYQACLEYTGLHVIGSRGGCVLGIPTGGGGPGLPCAPHPNERWTGTGGGLELELDWNWMWTPENGTRGGLELELDWNWMWTPENGTRGGLELELDWNWMWTPENGTRGGLELEVDFEVHCCADNRSTRRTDIDR
ncbi:hypothetical protein BV898_17393 [Hypsibius exemplaris]|uniref:Uncharacterized protein n=1 Tax=Hypsibius exemplaris TaxID=2072580 RepID=A0A9X6NFE3_HYPEX|nr:hypothetical protein BV898_17393 [Hypsibius exemplaris]